MPDISEILANETDQNNLVEYYYNGLKNCDQIPEIINQGLNLFLNYFQAKSSTLFLLNENTFDFEHRVTIPYLNKENITDYYSYLIDRGAIGQAIESGDIFLFTGLEPISEINNCIIIPLIISTSVLGLILLIPDKPLGSIETGVLKTASLYSGIFASKIENANLRNNLKMSQIILMNYFY